MAIIETLYNKLHKVSNYNYAKAERLEELQYIKKYISGLPKVRKYVGALLESILAELENTDTKNEALIKMCQELADELRINPTAQGGFSVLVVIGKNWCSKEVAKMLKEKYIIYNLETDINKDYVTDYDAIFVSCVEKEKAITMAQEYGISNVIWLYDILKSEFIEFSQTKEMITKFNRSCKEKNGQVKGVVTGCSYFRDAVHCDLIEMPTVSLANSSQDIFFDLQLFKKAVECLPALKFCLVGVAPYSLRYDESQCVTLQNHLMSYYTLCGSVHNSKKLSETIQFFDKEYEKLGVITGLEKKEDREAFIQNIYENSYVPKFGIVEYDRYEVFDEKEIDTWQLKEMEAKYRKPYSETIRENEELLKEYCSVAKEKGIKIFFLIPPFTKWYRSHWDETYYDEILVCLEKLSKEYNAEIIDMVRALEKDYYFRDYCHANRCGAIKIAEIINSVVGGYFNETGV